MSHGIQRCVTVAAAVAVVVGGSVTTVTAAPALGGYTITFTYEPKLSELVAVNELSYFPLGPTILFPVSISRVVNGAEQVVASGKGFLTYRCDGTEVTTYRAVGKELTVPCG